MKILGHGIDLYELASAEKRLNAPQGDWIAGVFTDAEVAQADPPPRHVEYYSGRYAAKEAVAKALGTGFSDEVAWLDIEILSRAAGAPEIRLRDGALEVANVLGVTRWLISISHSGGYAVASAIAVAD